MIGLRLAFALATASPAAPPDDGAALSVDALPDRIGVALPRDVTLQDHRGRTIALADLLDGERPLVLVPAYYRCPMLCGLTIAAVAETLGTIDPAIGRDVTVATFSIDPRDAAADAERARARAVDLHRRPIPADDWPFLTGSSTEIARLADAIGFAYSYDRATDQYAHASVVFVVGPDGTLTHVLPGVGLTPLDLQLALVDAGDGRIGSFAERTLLSCFRFDPVDRRYRFWVLGFLRLAGVLVLGTLGPAYLLLLRRDRQRARAWRRDPRVQR